MAAVIQIKRRVGTAGPPTALAEGELAFLDDGVTATQLYVGTTPAAVETLVSPARQVEIAGAQTITGAKTIDEGNLLITGGTTAGDVLSLVDPLTGALAWSPMAAGGLTTVVTDGTTIQGDGVAAATAVSLMDTTVVAGTYLGFDVDAQGRITGADPTTIVAGEIPVLTDGILITGTGATGDVITLGDTAVVPGTYLGFAVDQQGRITTFNAATIVAGTVPVVTDGLLISGTGVTADAITLENTTVVAGTYLGFDVDAQGRITGADPTSIVAGDVPVLTDGLLISGTGVTGDVITLAATTVVAGAYDVANITVDAQGRITAAAAAVAADLPGGPYVEDAPDALSVYGRRGPAATAVWEAIVPGLATVTTDATMDGDGTAALPLSVLSWAAPITVGIVVAATGGTDITMTAASVDGTAAANITNFEITGLDGGTY